MTSADLSGKEPEMTDNDEYFEYPVDGTLDLHAFSPAEVKDLIPEYLLECRKKGISEVRIIHGKGTGAMRETVHALLDRLDEIRSFRLAGQERGGWGATIAVLEPFSPDRER